MKKALSISAVAAVAASVAACGANPTDRAASGALLGAGAGAVGAALVDGSVGSAALIGGGLGAGAGYLLDPSTIYLGEPIWRQ